MYGAKAFIVDAESWMRTPQIGVLPVESQCHSFNLDSGLQLHVLRRLAISTTVFVDEATRDGGLGMERPTAALH